MNWLKWLFVCILIAVMAGYTANAQSANWSTTDRNLAVASAVLTVVDWRQTRNLVGREGYYERNLIMGKNPSIHEVNRHFLGVSLLLAGLAHFVPEYRTEILSIYVGVQTINTVRNYSIGLRMNF